MLLTRKKSEFIVDKQSNELLDPLQKKPKKRRPTHGRDDGGHSTLLALVPIPIAWEKSM